MGNYVNEQQTPLKPVAIDIWNTGRTLIDSGPRANQADSLQFRDACQADTLDRDGRPWKVLWTRASWEAEVGPLSVLSVLCIPAACPGV